MTQYDHPAKTQFLHQQHQQEMRTSENGRQESQAIPAQNPLVPANPYIREGVNKGKMFTSLDKQCGQFFYLQKVYVAGC